MDVLLIKLLFIVDLIIKSTLAISVNSSNNLPSFLRYHLPTDQIKPLRYDIDLNILMSDVIGESKMIFKVIQPSYVIRIHSARWIIVDGENIILRKHKELQESIKINGDSRIRVYRPVSMEYEGEKQFLFINFNRILLPDTYTMNIKYRYAIEDGDFHFTETDSENFVKNDSYFLSTDLYPTGARRLFPCWDEPALKAVFKISVKYNFKNNVNIFLSGSVNKTLVENSTLCTISNDTPPISPYLVAIVITNLDRVLPEKRINTYSRANITNNNVRFAEQIALRVLRRISNYTKFNTIPKIDIFVTPEEHQITQGWGMIVFSEQDVACTQNDTEDRKFAVARTVTRQIIHQCFSNLVSPSWWTDAWFNEAFTTFLQYFFLDSQHEYWRPMDIFVVHFQHLAFSKDDNSSLLDYYEYLDSGSAKIDEFFFHFTSNSYNKAPFLLRMLQHVVTEDIFREAVVQYISDFKFQSATPKQFWSILQNLWDSADTVFRPNCTIEEIIDTWLTQEGYPILYVERDNNHYRTRLLQIPLHEKYGPTFKNWWIPISFTGRAGTLNYGNTSVFIWKSPNEDTYISDIMGLNYTDNYDWIIFNVQQAGYYRVNYDPVYWRRIVQCLNSEEYIKIPTLNRAQIIDDSYYFLLKDQLNPNSTFLELISYLTRETDYIAWYPMNKVLSSMWQFYQYPEGTHIKTRVLKLLNTLYNKVTNVENYKEIKEQGEDLLLFAMHWACSFDHHECKTIASQKLKTYIAAIPKTQTFYPKISPRNRWICIGLMRANMTTWQKVFEVYMTTKDDKYLRILACIEDDAIILYYLHKLRLMQITEGLEDKSIQTAYNFIAQKHLTNEIVLDVMILCLTKLKLRNLDIKEMLSPIIRNVRNQTLFDQIKYYLKDHKVNITDSEVDNMITAQQDHITDELRKYQNLFGTERWNIIDQSMKEQN